MDKSCELLIALAADALEDARICGIAFDYPNDVDGVRRIGNYQSQVWASVPRLFLILESAQSDGDFPSAEVRTDGRKLRNHRTFRWAVLQSIAFS
jgi:hypothetical protein